MQKLSAIENMRFVLTQKHTDIAKYAQPWTTRQNF
jgi:hypothetical protein